MPLLLSLTLSGPAAWSVLTCRATLVEPRRSLAHEKEVHVSSSLATEKPEAPQHYDTFTILLHWTTAALVVFLWAIASPDIPMAGGVSFIDFFPNGQPRIAVRSLHITLGVMLIAVLLVRLSWRVTSGQKLPPADQGLLGAAAKFVHYSLYVLLATTLILGLANVWVRGDNIFGLFNIPAFNPNDRTLRQTVGNLHGWAANTLLIVAGMHALAALFHHYVLRDAVLRRMLPARRTDSVLP
jgi:cytochrome b561